MADVEKETREVLKSFGFDDFMVGQMVQRLKLHGLIGKPLPTTKIHAILMTPEEGYKYELVDIGDGKTGVFLTENGLVISCSCEVGVQCDYHHVTDPNSDELKKG